MSGSPSTPLICFVVGTCDAVMCVLLCVCVLARTHGRARVQTTECAAMCATCCFWTGVRANDSVETAHLHTGHTCMSVWGYAYVCPTVWFSGQRKCARMYNNDTTMWCIVEVSTGGPCGERCSIVLSMIFFAKASDGNSPSPVCTAQFEPISLRRCKAVSSSGGGPPHESGKGCDTLGSLQVSSKFADDGRCYVGLHVH